MKEDMNASASFRPQTRRRMSVPEIGFNMKCGVRATVCKYWCDGVLRCVTVYDVTLLRCYDFTVCDGVLRCVTVCDGV